MLNERKSEGISPLTNEQLASLGGGRLAYLKPILSEDVGKILPEAPPLRPGMKLFALLAADGTPIAVTDTRDAAVANAMEHELEMVSVH